MIRGGSLRIIVTANTGTPASNDIVPVGSFLMITRSTAGSGGGGGGGEGAAASSNSEMLLLLLS